MANERRDKPRGLVAPLSQAQLASLKAVGDGALSSLPIEHHNRLLQLELVHETAGGLVITNLGRERLISDR